MPTGIDRVPARVGRRLRAMYSRTRHRLGLRERFAGDAAVSRSFSHPIDVSRRGDLIARYRALFPEAAAAEMDEAARLRAHRFTVLGHAVEHGARIAWSRDPVSGRDWSGGFSGDIVYRGPRRLGDVKLPWELSKHQYFFTLGKAAWLSGDPAWADEIVRQIDAWIADNPYLRGVNWISALEAGTRAVSWILAYPYYADRCDDGFRARLARALAEHFHFVEHHASVRPFANNHLVGDAAALVVGGLFLECGRSDRWVRTGLQILEDEMLRQVTPDGVHAERSVSYHRFVLDQYHLVDAMLRANGRSFPAATRDGMARMTAFLMDVLAGDGTAPAIGDGDDARGLWCHAGAAADYRSPLALGAVLFARGDFKQAARRVSEEVLWLFGAEGVDRFEHLRAQVPDHTSVAYRDGGYCVMRGGRHERDAVLVFDAGPLGYGPAAHGHADALSVHLHAAGYPFLIDPGAFSYNLDYAWRDAFRSTRAHNTVVVDGAGQSEPGDRMSWRTAAASRLRNWVSTGAYDFADAEHDGYLRLPDPVTHRRTVLYLKPDVWIVRDHLEGRGSHEAEVLWHLRPDCRVTRDGPAIVLESPHGARLTIRTFGPDGDPCAAGILEGTDDERGAWYSPRYGSRVPSRTVSVRCRFQGETTLTTNLSL